jgi:calcineurin-like phosphoesterase family protein
MKFDKINLGIDDPWIISDTHFFHENIIKYCDRPFKDVEEMNETMVTNWNNLVKPDDWIIHLGDVSFGRIERSLEILSRLNGNKVLIAGNHDWGKHMKSYNEQGTFQQIYKGEGFEFQGKILSHKPIIPAHLGDGFNIHGHLHNNVLGSSMKDMKKHKYNLKRYVNISVENYNYSPIKFQDINAKHQ